MNFQTGRLTVEMTTFGGVSHVELVGQIDERADLNLIASKVEWSAVFDLSAVSFINSIGVREWVRLLRTLHDKNVLVSLRRCSEAMVHEMNVIAETVAYVRVESFFLPYMCDACGAESSACIDVEQHRAQLRLMQPPLQHCPECKGNMSFADIPGRYLLFAAQAAEHFAI
jgi:hypothetical protein